jgi:hypothetical protein
MKILLLLFAMANGPQWHCVTYLHVPGGDYQVCSTITYL